MKRTILSLAFVACVLVIFGGVGFWVVKYVLMPPLSINEMKDLENKGDQASGEIPRLIACFEKGDEDVHLQAELTLKAIGAKAVEPLKAKLKDSNPKVRFYAVETLGWIGPPSAPAVEEVRACLKDEDASVRYKAAYSLGCLGVTNDAVINGLVKALEDSDERVPGSAIEALQKMGSPAVAKLYLMLDTSKDPIRGHLLAVLEKGGPPPKESLPGLVKLAKDLPPHERAAIIAILGKAGPQLSPHLTELVGLFILGDNWTSLLSIYKQCGGEGAKSLATVIKSMQKDPALTHLSSIMILKALGEIGSEAKTAVPTLIELLASAPPLRTQILDTLGRHRP